MNSYDYRRAIKTMPDTPDRFFIVVLVDEAGPMSEWDEFVAVVAAASERYAERRALDLCPDDWNNPQVDRMSEITKARFDWLTGQAERIDYR